MPGTSDEVRKLLQGGIQIALQSFKGAGIHEREDLSTLLTFYRAMHSMSLNAMKIELTLEGVLNGEPAPKTSGLFREFGARSDSRLPETSTAETEDLRQHGGNADRNGVEGEIGAAEPIGQGGTPYIVLDFGRPQEPDVV